MSRCICSFSRLNDGPRFDGHGMQATISAFLAGRAVGPAHLVFCLFLCKGQDGRLFNRLLDTRSISFAFFFIYFPYDFVIGIASESTFIYSHDLPYRSGTACGSGFTGRDPGGSINLFFLSISIFPQSVFISVWASGAIGMGHHVLRSAVSAGGGLTRGLGRCGSKKPSKSRRETQAGASRVSRHAKPSRRAICSDEQQGKKNMLGL